MERQHEQQAGSADRDREADQPSGHGEDTALDERLRDDLPPGCADREAQRRLRPPGGGPRQQQVGDVRAGDEQHEAAHGEQDLEAAPVLFLHHTDAGAGRDDGDHLLGERPDDVRHPVDGIAGLVLDPRAEKCREARGHAVGRRAWPQPTDDAQPGPDRLVEQRAAAVDDRFLVQRDEQVGRIGAQRLAEEPRRRHADDREGMPLDHERGPDDRRVGAVGVLPGVMAEHHDGSRRRPVVVGREQAAAEWPDPEHREIAAAHVFGPERPGGRIDPLAAHAQPRASGLERRRLLELRRCRLQPLVQRIGDHSPAVLRAAFDAAVVAVADPVEPGRVGDRQRTQHDRVDQREDGRGAADAQRQRQHGGGREDGRQPELAERVSDGAGKATHTLPLDGFGLPIVGGAPPSGFDG